VNLRYYGHFLHRTGYGVAARHLARALAGAGHRLHLRPLGQPAIEPGELSEHFEDHGQEPDAVIVHTLPRDCHRVLEIENLHRGRGPKLVAYTTWEALTAPLEVVHPLYERFDQLWAPSRPCALAFASNGLHASAGDRSSAERRTFVIPHGYERFLAGGDDQGYRGNRFYRFYWVGAWTARKNPQGLIRAFAYAFTARDQVELVLHSPGVSRDTFVAALAACGLEQSELPAIRLSNVTLTDEEVARLHLEGDCFVSAARGEAWNLPAFDALLAGRHVITQYGLGSDEFLIDTTADLIDGWESPAQVDVTMAHSEAGEVTVRTLGAQGLSARSLWLEPNLSSLADAMRAAYEARTRSITLDYDPASRFSYAAVEQQVLNVLENS